MLIALQERHRKQDSAEKVKLEVIISHSQAVISRANLPLEPKAEMFLMRACKAANVSH